MVQIIENWSDLMGVVQAISPTANNKFIAITIRVTSSVPVEGYAHLLDKVVGKEIEVLMPANLIEEYKLTIGMIVQCRVRRADIRRNFIHKGYLKVQITPEGI